MVTRIHRRQPYRRRRPWSLLPTFISLSAVTPLLLTLVASGVAAQTTSSITDPSTITIELVSAASAFFHLASPSSSPVWVSLSLCSPPPAFLSSFDGSATLPYKLDKALFLSNTSAVTQPGPDNIRDADESLTAAGSTRLDASTGAYSDLSRGYANATLESGADGGIWIGVFAPDTAALLEDLEGGNGSGSGTDSSGGGWTFELQVSSGTASPPYVVEGAASFRLGDTDSSTALLTTANYTAAGDDTPAPPQWQALVAPTQPNAFALGRSHCAVRAAVGSAVGTANASATTRGYGGGTRTQFVVEGLAPGRNYTAWLVANETDQTRVWDPVHFATKSGALSSPCAALFR